MARTIFKEVLTIERYKIKCQCDRKHFFSLTPQGACSNPGRTLVMVDHDPVFLCRACIERLKGEIQ